MRSAITGTLLLLSIYSYAQENVLGEFRLLLSAGDTVNAMFMLERELMENDDNWTLRYNLALLQLTARDTTSAINNFEKIVEQNDTFLDPCYYLGNYYFEQDSVRKSEYYYSLYLSTSPDNMEVRHKRAQSNMRLGDYYSAITDWSYLAKLDSNPDIIFNRGLSRLSLNDLEGAIDDFSNVIEMDQSYSDAWYFKGLAYYHSYEKVEAEKSWNNVIKLDPEYTNAWYQLSLLNWQMGKKRKTCKYLEKAIILGWEPSGEEGRKIVLHCNN